MMYCVQIHERMIFVREDRDDYELNPNKGQGQPAQAPGGTVTLLSSTFVVLFSMCTD